VIVILVAIVLCSIIVAPFLVLVLGSIILLCAFPVLWVIPAVIVVYTVWGKGNQKRRA